MVFYVLGDVFGNVGVIVIVFIIWLIDWSGKRYVDLVVFLFIMFIIFKLVIFFIKVIFKVFFQVMLENIDL